MQEIDGLPPRRAAFVAAYTDLNSPTFGNGERSAIAAGYSDTGRTPAVTASRILSDANVASATAAAFAAQGLTATWRANLLKRYAEDGDASWKRAPAIRALELTARMDGSLRDADVNVNVDARSALLPGNLDAESLLTLLQQAAGAPDATP